MGPAPMAAAADALDQRLRRRLGDVDERDAGALGAELSDQLGADAAATAADEQAAPLEARVAGKVAHERCPVAAGGRSIR